MENSKLPWRVAAASRGGEWGVLGLEKGKLGLVLLLSGSDAEDCCAKNYERTVFRSSKVVKFAKSGPLVPFRLDRNGGVGSGLYAQYELDAKKPALLVIDGDGTLLYRTQLCTEPRDALKGMRTAVVVSLRKQKYAPTAAKRLKKARTSILEKNYRSALATMARIDDKYLTASLAKKVKRYLKKIKSDGIKRLKLARKYEKRGDQERARSIYKEVASSFSRIKKLKDYARGRLREMTARS